METPDDGCRKSTLRSHGRRGGLILVWTNRGPSGEISFTTVAAYGSFLLAEKFHLSGVLATLTAALMLGTIGLPGATTDRGREAVEAFLGICCVRSQLFGFSADWHPRG